MDRTVLVCQNTVCRKQGSPKVLAALVGQAPDGISVTGSGCLGQCGSGPTVLILPEQTWCLRVQPYLVPSLVKEHFENEAVIAPSSKRKSWRIWAISFGIAVVAIGLLTWIIAQQTYYF